VERNDERDLAIANREKIRRMYLKKPKSKLPAAESTAQEAQTDGAQESPAPVKKAAVTQNMFGGW
jgi:hypothetical protein